MLEWLESIRGIIEIYPILSLIVLIPLGYEAIIFLTFLSGAGYFSLNLGTIFVIAFLEIIILDYIYYNIGRIDLIKHITPRMLSKKRYSSFFDQIKKKTHNNVFTLLFLSKFFYGFRQTVAIYFGYHKLQYSEFSKKDTLAVFIYLIVMLPIIWIMGNTIQTSLSDIKELEKIVMLGIIILVIIFYITKRIMVRMANQPN